MHNKLFLTTLALAVAPTALSYCVSIGGEGQTGFGVYNSFTVWVDDALICTAKGLEGGQGKVPCGDGGSEGGTLEYDWGTIQGPFDATYCDEKGRCTTVTFQDDWNCSAQNCCGGNIPCQCWACFGNANVCV